MIYNTRDLETIKAGIIDRLRVVGSPLTDTSAGSVTNSLVQSLAASHVQLDNLYANLVRNIDINTAVGINLDALARQYGLERLGAVSASGYSIWSFNSLGEVLNISPGDLIVNLTTGLQYYVNTSANQVLSSNVELIIPIVALGVGSDYNITEGSELVLLKDNVINNNIRVRIGNKRDLAGNYCGGLSNGRNAETDDEFRNRLRLRIRNIGSIGEPAAYLSITQQPFVNRVWIDNSVPGLANILVESIQPLTSEQTALLRNLVDAAKPVGIAYTINSVEEFPLDINIDVSLINSRASTDIELIIRQYIQTIDLEGSFLVEDLRNLVSPYTYYLNINSPIQDLNLRPNTVFKLNSLQINSNR